MMLQSRLTLLKRFKQATRDWPLVQMVGLFESTCHHYLVNGVVS
ncbi:UNVERIFIED_CONTAM: hypothetical protein GTU68_023823 [Idotea baltica]|nr:hypothetical protein [Idotea baltica]